MNNDKVPSSSGIENNPDDKKENNIKTNRASKHHLIKTTWLRRLLKTVGWLFLFILLLPVLLYLPPVQDFAVKFASDYVAKSTGMKINIGKFRLRFPLDISLEKVSVLEASGDTMVRAGEVLADVKLLPLLKLDLDIEKLSLLDGYYRMVSPDSSMILTVDAGKLDVDDKSAVNLRDMHILLNKANISDGRLSLFMDVWKQQKDTVDTASSSTPMVIEARDLKLNNFTFAMSMLPTIDTMDVNMKTVEISNAKVDLGKNLVQWKRAAIADGSFTYLAPTPEWVAAHPAPPSEPSSGPPMVIKGDSISLDRVTAHYGIVGAKPLPGFDANYIEVNVDGLGLKDFYNESSTVRLPLTRMKARERCGLAIERGSGLVTIDSIGLGLENFSLATPYTRLAATAKIPFAMMSGGASPEMNVDAKGRVGLPDIDAFMPDLKSYTSMVPGRNPLDFDIKAAGTLARLAIQRLDASIREVVALKAKGEASNLLDVKKLTGHLDFDGTLSDPSVAERFMGQSEIKIPAFNIKGKADAKGMAYGADFNLTSTAGDLAAVGKVALTPETYQADLSMKNINVGQFLPSLGIGHVSGSVVANGAGFNPLSGKAVTDARVVLSAIEYNNVPLRDIHADISLDRDGLLTLFASSPNPGLDLDVDGTGRILHDDYTFDLVARLRDLNLQKLGLSDSLCQGSGDIRLAGTASPGKWTYDVDLAVERLDWNLPDQFIHLPAGVTAHVKTDPFNTALNVESLLTRLDFKSEAGLEKIISSFTSASNILTAQIKDRNLNVDTLSSVLPPFNLDINASGRGLLSQVLGPTGISLDTVSVNLAHDSLLTGRVDLLQFASGSLQLDTINLNLKSRGTLLDYKAHLGNRPGTLDEFAEVSVNGYLGKNRIGAFLTQHNIKGEMGYRIGLTASMLDSVLSVHFTPLKATIAYLPWTFNADNYLDCNLSTLAINANLLAKSAQSSILAKTEPGEFGQDELHVKIDNLHIEDFLQMAISAPPLTASINADMNINYSDSRLDGRGTLGIHRLTYDKMQVGDLDLDFDAGYGLNGSSDLKARLLVNGEKAVGLVASLSPHEGALKADSIGLNLTRFPLNIANPFLGDNVNLSGWLNGRMQMSGSFTEPLLNGHLAFDSVKVELPIMASSLSLDHSPVAVEDNVVTFENFNIRGANDNPLTLSGTVNARSFSNILFDLGLNATNFQLLNTDKRSRGDLYGKIFLTLGATVKGPMKRLNIDGNVNLLGTTDATYRLNMAPSELKSQEQDIVKFVNFNDSSQVAKSDSIVESSLNMRITAGLTISPGTQATVMLSTNGTDKLIVNPTANLRYFQNYMGDMTLNGTLTLGDGYVRYSIPIIGERMFTFNPASNVKWTGELMDPILDITAYDEMKANVNDNGNSRLVNFLITLQLSNTLERLNMGFDLSSPDDLTIQNELQTMSADQRQTQAMNLLLYNQYSASGTKANTDLSGNVLYSLLESQLNSWLAQNVRGVDLSFGIDQYSRTVDGNSATQTSYSYQLSKSLFNNRFKILVGGNYSTDASPDANLANNLVSDVSLEYILKQTQTLNMSVRLFRHVGYESILEGEITEMGVAFVMRRSLSNLANLFHFGRRKRKKLVSALTESDSTKSVQVPDSIKEILEEINKNEKEVNEKK